MPRHARYDGQRKHIIHSLESLLYQLHALSFLLSPSIWIYLARVTSQFQFSRPRAVDENRTLRFWFALIMLFQIGAVWTHAKEGAAQGRPIILDFVGMATVPSRLHLLSLDFLIIFLEMLLTTVAYEASYAAAMPPGTPDPLLPLSPTIPTPLPSTSDPTLKYPEPTSPEASYAIDLRFSLVVDRLRNPPAPAPRNNSPDDLLPLPNTTSLPLSSGLQMLLRARQQIRERARAADTTAVRRQRADETARTGEEDGDEDADERQEIPGGLDTGD